jgi:Ca2+-binding EF-hand superfamily protein
MSATIKNSASALKTFSGPAGFETLILDNARALDGLLLVARHDSQFQFPKGAPTRAHLMAELRTLFERTTDADGHIVLDYDTQVHFGTLSRSPKGTNRLQRTGVYGMWRASAPDARAHAGDIPRPPRQHARARGRVAGGLPLEDAMKMFRSTALATVCFALCGGAAFANHHSDDYSREHMAEKFKAADRNGNGSLDQEEAKALPHVAKNFDRLDTSRDGSVSQAELADGMKSMHGKGRKMHRKGVAAFQKADTDRDGTLDRSEAAAMPRVAKNFETMDTDRSGTVSLEEIQAYMELKRPRDED